jgi:hypothetical protein
MTTDTMHKPVVEYQPSENDYIVLGNRAFVKPINHPQCSNNKEVLTSPILQHLEIDGVLCFETENTIYRPAHHA